MMMQMVRVNMIQFAGLVDWLPWQNKSLLGCTTAIYCNHMQIWLCRTGIICYSNHGKSHEIAQSHIQQEGDAWHRPDLKRAIKIGYSRVASWGRGVSDFATP